MLFLACACARADQSAPESIVLFSSSQTHSGIDKQTARLAQLYTAVTDQAPPANTYRKMLGLRVSSAGSCGSLKSLMDARSDFGVVRADVAEAIYHRPTLYGYDLSLDHLRVVGHVSPSYVNIVARKKTPSTTDNSVAVEQARTVSDLNGAKVGIGVPDELTKLIIADLFARHGASLKNMEKIQQPLEESVGLLESGQLDAIVLIDQLPSPLIEALLASGSFELISLDPTVLAKHIKASSNPSIYSVHSREVAGHSQPVVTLMVATLLLSRKTLPPQNLEPLSNMAALLAETARARVSETQLAHASEKSLSNINSVDNPILSIPTHDAVGLSPLKLGQTLVSKLSEE